MRCPRGRWTGPWRARHAEEPQTPLTFEQFRYAYANAVSEQEARDLYEKYAIPAPCAPPSQPAAANLNPERKQRSTAAIRGAARS